MSGNVVEIAPYGEEHQQDVDEVMDSIAAEYEENIYSPQFKKLNVIAALPNHTYWVAKAGVKVVGTIGILAMENNNVELKRLFLSKEYRGKGVSQALLETALRSAKNSGLRTMFLGTMSQFRAAQAFYAKNGFIKIPRESLPADFHVNPVDKVFFRKEL